MIEKLEKAEARFVKLEESLTDPEIYKDQESYAALMKERKSLAPIIEKYRAYKAAVAARDGAAENAAADYADIVHNLIILQKRGDFNLFRPLAEHGKHIKNPPPNFRRQIYELFVVISFSCRQAFCV